MSEDNQSIEFDQLEQAINDDVFDTQQGQPEIIEPDTKDVLAPVLQMGFAVLAPNWQVSQPEIDQLAEVYSGLLDKYLPNGIGSYGLEVSAVMVTAAVVLPRLNTPRKDLVDQPKPDSGEGVVSEAA